jgi:2-aminoadipate transaminase
MSTLSAPPQLAPFARRMRLAEVSAVREILKVTEMPDVISFAGGLPAPELFPAAEIAQSFYEVISGNGAAALQYSTTEGFPPLREYIAARMRGQGMRAAADDILITSGSQQGLDLAAKVLVNAGDKVIVERPTYLAAIQTLSLFEADFVTVGSDDDGMDVDEAERKLAEHGDVKLIYLVANFQNPSGTTLSLRRRERLIELAEEYGVRILEDDPYGELRYRGRHLPPLKALDPENHVVYLSTFSKTMTPGLRLGWMVADAALYAKLVIAKQATDLHTNTAAQRAAHHYLTHYSPEAHVEKIRAVYGERCEVMLDALARHFPAGVRWTKPEGGMFLWVELPPEVDAAALLQEALKEKVAFVPGAPFFANEKPRNFMRLNFSNQQPERIEEGVRRLARVIAAAR